MADRGPPVSLIALRDRREDAIQQLSDGFAADLLSVNEFESRLALVHGAATMSEIEAVVADLPPLPSGVSSTALAPLSVDRALAVAATRIRSLLGNVERRGGWVVPARLEVRVAFGNLELDFRNARFTAPVTELHARVMFGNLEMIVPPQLAVACEASSILGNVESHGTAAVPDPDRPLLRIRGRAVLGNIEIHTYLPGETAHDWARRRSRQGRGMPAKERTPAMGPIRPE